MKRIKSLKLNNKAFSLVELLVTMAVSAIVLLVIGAFLTSGTRSFNKQSNSIDIQNELQSSSNFVIDALMESTELNIKNETDAIVITTGDFDADNKVEPKLICWIKDTKKLFVTDMSSEEMADSADDISEGYCVSKYVTNFTINIDEESYEHDEAGNRVTIDGKVVLKKAIILNVSIKVGNNGEERSDSRTIKLRNKLNKFVFNGTEYTVQ